MESAKNTNSPQANTQEKNDNPLYSKGHLVMNPENQKMKESLSGSEYIDFLFNKFKSKMDEVTSKMVTNLKLTLAPDKMRVPLNDCFNNRHVVKLLNKAENVIVVAGAGISVSCGIPDFRSRSDGVYAKICKKYPDLPCAESLTSIDYFNKDPRPFFDFAASINSKAVSFPSKAHKFIKSLQDQGKLLRLYTQNIDTLEEKVGMDLVDKTVFCHGSFRQGTCMLCGRKYEFNGNEVIMQNILNKDIPYCDCSDERFSLHDDHHADHNDKNKPNWSNLPIIKPNIVFFGEDLPPEFLQKFNHDKKIADFLIVIGSSMKVKPVSQIPLSLEKNCPQILINKESLENDLFNFDVEYLGEADVVCEFLEEQLVGLGGGKNLQTRNRLNLKNFQQTIDIKEVNEKSTNRYFIDKDLFHQKYLFRGITDELMNEISKRIVYEIKTPSVSALDKSVVSNLVTKNGWQKNKNCKKKVSFDG